MSKPPDRDAPGDPARQAADPHSGEAAWGLDNPDEYDLALLRSMRRALAHAPWTARDESLISSARRQAGRQAMHRTLARGRLVPANDLDPADGASGGRTADPPHVPPDHRDQGTRKKL